MSKSNDSNGTVQTPWSSRDADKPVPREKLPDALQKIVDDDDDSLMEQIYEGTYVFQHTESFPLHC
jgi:hypothetical protein